MTLVELLVGMVVAGAAIAGGYGALATVLDQRDRADSAMAEIMRAATQRRTLAAWLGGARLTIESPDIQFRGLDGYFGDQPDDAVSFLTTSATSVGHAEVIVRLRIDRDSLTPERGLVADLTAPGSTAVERVEIAPEVAGLELRHFSTMLGRGEWLPSWISSSVLPAAVEVTLLPVAGDSLPGPLRPPILVPLGTTQ